MKNLYQVDIAHTPFGLTQGQSLMTDQVIKH